ncbi:MAG: hypothetical protein ACRDJ1_09425 [Actinomycetota bacterium]
MRALAAASIGDTDPRKVSGDGEAVDVAGPADDELDGGVWACLVADSGRAAQPVAASKRAETRRRLMPEETPADAGRFRLDRAG